MWANVWTRRALLSFLGVSVACSRKPKIRIPPPIPAVLRAKETGQASWYGHPYHGRRASSGEIYDMNQMTAAHLRLPFGTWVRVTNLGNGRRADVRINDRGPFVKNRIIDLSRASAQQIEMIGPGTARVRLEVIALPGTAPPGQVRAASQAPKAPPPSRSAQPPPGCGEGSGYGVQVGSFRILENAERMRGKMKEAYGDGRVLGKQTPAGDLFSVIVGAAPDSYTANQWLARLQKDNVNGFVVFFEQAAFLDCL